MLVEGKMYYLITFYDTFYKTVFVRTQAYAAQSNLTEYVFRTKLGDIHLSGSLRQTEKNNNFVSEDFEAAKIEIAKRVYRGKSIARLPMNQSRILSWAMEKYPDKLL